MLEPSASELEAPAPVASPVASLARPRRGAKPRVDSWFKHRMLFLFAVVIAYSVKLSFFADSAASQFTGLALGPGDMVEYARFRVVLLLLITASYLYSYLKDWHFEKMSVFFVGIILTALALDYANAYFLLLDKPPSQFALALLTLRLMTVYCMVMNAVNAGRAPPMPRRLWS